MAAAGPMAIYLGSSACALAALLAGLLAFAVYPLIGVLLTLAGMALLLYGAAGLCGGQLRRKN